MIYVKQSYNIVPAAPSTRDRVIDVVNKYVLPANERHGARLVGAFFAHEDWFSQVIHLTEFDDFAGFQTYREATANDGEAAEGEAQMTNLAPEQRVEFLEPLGPVAPTRLQQAIAASVEKSVGTYTFAILDVTPDKLEQFTTLLDGAAAMIGSLAAALFLDRLRARARVFGLLQAAFAVSVALLLLRAPEFWRERGDGARRAVSSRRGRRRAAERACRPPELSKHERHECA